MSDDATDQATRDERLEELCALETEKRLWFEYAMKWVRLRYRPAASAEGMAPTAAGPISPRVQFALDQADIAVAERVTWIMKSGIAASG